MINDGELAVAASAVGPNFRFTAAFQVLPRVYGGFRYSKISNIDPPTTTLGGDTFDRSFDIHFQMLDETKYRPAMAIGLRDFLGTGILSSEYIVATKRFGSNIDVTGGMGWGRLAGRGSFSNPLSVFPDRFGARSRGANRGGQLETGNWFRGPASLFGGVKWKINDKATFFAEYSPDLYTRESVNTGIDISPPNFGLEYRFKNGVNLKGFVVGGNEIGAELNYGMNPRKRKVPRGMESAPQSIGQRNRLAIANWNSSQKGGGKVAAQRFLESRLAADSGVLQDFTMSGTQATVRVENHRWSVEAQAAGRPARAMAATLPSQIKQHTFLFQSNGLPISRVVVNLSDPKELKFDYDESCRTLARADIEDVHDETRLEELEHAFPVYESSLGP